MTSKTHDTAEWLVKDSNGQITGPYSTEEITSNIKSGQYTEQHLIANSLTLQWSPLGKNKVFHGLFLQKSIELARQKKHKVSTEEEESLVNSLADELKSFDTKPFQKEEPQVALPNRSTFKKPNLNSKKKSPKKRKAYKPSKKTIPLESRKKLINRNKRTVLFLLLVSSLSFVIYTLLFEPQSITKPSLLHLRSPNFASKTAYDESAFQNLLQLSLKNFQADSFSQYIKTQNYLIQAIQMKPREKTLYSFLCLTYLELWPYTYRSFE
ncbi:MAG: hypothetical protein HAW63_05765, partial [Bdellovibrionaceae bacterium]|nr:hypothetical protein [Pseudobdellovibrionaceae bacterium]